jgi:NAD(P)-dependent dehydrogenase (short-subunit alcohol dehydrogenase family)
MVQQTIDAYGSIDILVLNAGISMWAEFEKIEDISFFNTLMAVNYTGSVNCVHAALPELKKSDGKITAITTAQALIGFPHHSGYAASKHALHGFLETLDIELEDKVRFLNVYLGWIKGTNLRQSAFGADGSIIGEKRHEHNSNAIDLEDCTRSIVLAIKSDKKRVYIPKKIKLIPYLNIFAKNWLWRKILKNVRDHDSD